VCVLCKCYFVNGSVDITCGAFVYSQLLQVFERQYACGKCDNPGAVCLCDAPVSIALTQCAVLCCAVAS
jgi:hypothetical protein